jgi:hypothetical protein
MMKLLRLPPRGPRPASKKRGRGHQWDPRLLVPPINPPFPAASRSYRLKKYLLYGFRSSPIELSTIGAPTPVGRERPCGEQARQPWNCSKQCSTRWPWDYSEEERATVLGSSVHQRATPSSTSERGREGDDAAPPRRTRAAGPPAPGTPSPHGAGPGPPRCPCAPPVSFPLHPSHSRHSTRQTATYGNKMERGERLRLKGGALGPPPFFHGTSAGGGYSCPASPILRLRATMRAPVGDSRTSCDISTRRTRHQKVYWNHILPLFFYLLSVSSKIN